MKAQPVYNYTFMRILYLQTQGIKALLQLICFTIANDSLLTQILQK